MRLRRARVSADILAALPATLKQPKAATIVACVQRRPRRGAWESCNDETPLFDPRPLVPVCAGGGDLGRRDLAPLRLASDDRRGTEEPREGRR